MDRLPDDVLARRAALPKKPAPVTLTGERVILRPIDLDRDCQPLYEVQSGRPFTLAGRSVGAYDAEELVWKWMKGHTQRDAAGLRAYLEPLANGDDSLVFVACDRPTTTQVGVVCYMANRPADLKVELGGIWYGPIAQGTGISRESTRLLCAHAFSLGYRRVEWKCDTRNERSRRAALSYGFTFEGIQERHMIVKDRSRDTAWFRMLDHELDRT